MFHHVTFQACIIVWVFLMSGELEIIQSWIVNMKCQSVMACHSVQTDKLLCCQSGRQIKQIVRVINGKQKDEKTPYLITMPQMHQMIDVFLHSTPLQLSSFACNATQASQLGGQRRE